MKPFYLILPLALAGFILAIAAPDASAAAFKAGMVDPAVVCVNTPAPGNNSPCDIYSTGVSNIVAFQPCTSPPLPGGVIPAGSGFTDCLWMYNATDTSLATFDFRVPLPVDFEPGDTLDCITINPSNPADPTLTPTAGCDQTFVAGDTYFDMSFTASPSVVAENAGFFLLMSFDGRIAPDAVRVIVGVPEPGELGLFGLGLLGIGVGYGWKKRRQSHRINYVA